jgi:PTH2 family peptidyl-tRNA hydrolase
MPTVHPHADDDPPEVRVLVNTDVSMSRHKAAAQAVHAALAAFGIPHGRVVVLGGRSDEVAAMDAVVRDAGRTEVAPGTLTAGATVVR